MSTILNTRQDRRADRTYEELLSQLPEPYTPSDISRFVPSAAVYFMDGYSDATFRLYASGEEITLRFWDQNTSIAATAPLVYDEKVLESPIYLVAPPPLRPRAYLPYNTPDRYKRPTTLHLMQVISMNMRDREERSACRLLIGLPYAEKYPDIFFNKSHFEPGRTDASSYGVVQSLTEFKSNSTGRSDVDANGYPARSFFAIYHVLETSVGTFFNKKATQMELQPSPEGKLALTLPPIPFNYSLINAPIPLFDVRDPDGQPVGEVYAAHHESAGAASRPTPEAWPWHQPQMTIPEK